MLALLCALVMVGCRTVTLCFRAKDYMIVDVSAGPSAKRYPVRYLRAPPDRGWTDEFKTTKIVFRRIPAGVFLMGRAGTQTNSETVVSKNLTLVISPPAGRLGHPVSLTNDYFMGVFEISQKQWERVMGTWPSYFRNAGCRDLRPVEQVSYDDIRGADAGALWPATSTVDASSFMGRLRARTGKAFDLPTEAQWEYAGRAGTSSDLNSGQNLADSGEDACMVKVGRYLYNSGYIRTSRWFTPDSDAGVATAPVGSYMPNAWGLYDIHGNVWEQCLDWYEESPGASCDPKGPPAGVPSLETRVKRGGGWGSQAWLCKTISRGNSTQDERYNENGFRCALTLKR